MVMAKLDNSTLRMSETHDKSSLTGMIFDIQRFSINDGPGIRTTVFFKGCPLTCLWCDNPESQKSNPELLYFDSLCVRCYRCVAVCPTGATTMAADGSIAIDRKLCQACGTCVQGCPSEARAISGKLMTVDEVLDIVKKDSLFYRNSGGGVTASGGEPTHQPVFLEEFFRRCQESGLHTALDTCGYVRWEVLERVLEHVDLVLFDVKHMDPATHMALTGADNKLILENAKNIVRKGKPMVLRLPLIPGCNESEENIKSVAEFAVQIEARRIDILPYHGLGINKYKRLGEEYKLTDVKPHKEEQVQAIKHRLESYGLDVLIG